MPKLLVLAQILLFATYANAHCSLIDIHGSNNKVGHAFGVDLNGKYPRKVGQPGDAGGDSGVFQTGTNNPSPPCGSTPELGQLDVVSWLSQAEGSGLPAAHPNGSIVALAFQVNRDGGGPMLCEYNEDATAKSFKPMKMILNQSGNNGVGNLLRVNETVVMQFPTGAKCTGGWTETACIIRCRTGVNKRFGGCFAAKLAGTQAPIRTVCGGSRTRQSSRKPKPKIMPKGKPKANKKHNTKTSKVKPHAKRDDSRDVISS